MHGDVEPAIAGLDAALFPHAGKVAIHLGVAITRTAACADTHGDTGTGSRVVAGVVAGVLLAVDVQVAPHIRHHPVGRQHRAIQRRVIATEDGRGVARRQVAIALGHVRPIALTVRGAGVGSHPHRRAVRAIVHRHTDRRAAALAAAVLLACVLCRLHRDVVVGRQQQVVARFDVAATDQEVAVVTAAGGDQGDVAAGMQGRALAGVAVLLALAMTAAAAHGDGDVDARSLHGVLGAVGREQVAHRLARPIRAVRRRRPGQRLHPRIALGLAARLRAVQRPLRQVQRRRGHRHRQPALLERRLLRVVAGVMYLGNRDVLGLGGDVALQRHHIAAGDRQRVARHQRHVAVQAAHRAASVGQRAASGIGLERLLAVGDAEATIAEQAALLALAVVFFAVRVLRRLQGEVVAGGQHHIAGADDLRALRQQIVARRDLHRVATQAARHRNAVVALVVRGRRLAGEELFLARLLVHHAVVLFLRRRQRHVVAGGQGDAAGLARHRRRCQGQVVACAHHDVAARTQLRALHVFVVGGGDQRVALAHAAGRLRRAVHHRLTIEVVTGLHR